MRHILGQRFTSHPGPHILSLRLNWGMVCHHLQALKPLSQSGLCLFAGCWQRAANWTCRRIPIRHQRQHRLHYTLNWHIHWPIQRAALGEDPRRICRWILRGPLLSRRHPGAMRWPCSPVWPSLSLTYRAPLQTCITCKTALGSLTTQQSQKEAINISRQS